MNGTILSNQNELLILKEKLENVKKAKRTSFTIILLVALVAAGILGRLLMVDMLSGVELIITLVPVILILVGAIWLSDRHYDKQKTDVLSKIEKLSVAH
jgi:uncharacterized membrane-anchored protein